jgi:hypothetical protein
MSRPLFRRVVALFSLALFVKMSIAQPPAPPVRPTFSPYLNLLRGGGSPALNYYGLVRPEQNLQQNLQGIQMNQATTSSNLKTVNDILAGNITPTGVASQFMNHGRYFLNQGTGGGGVGTVGAQRLGMGNATGNLQGMMGGPQQNTGFGGGGGLGAGGLGQFGPRR